MKELSIREKSIYEFIVKEFNDNVFGSKIQFAIGNYSAEVQGDSGFLYVQRLALVNDRFDIKETYDENTYMTSKKSVVIMSIASLNGEALPYPQNKIKDWVYQPSIEILICQENINVFNATNIAIEEVRSRLIQYHTVIETEAPDLNNTSSTAKVKEFIKITTTADSIDYGSPVIINGKTYITYSLTLTINATNYGEFANIENISLGVNSIQEGGSIKMFEVTPIEWGWGVGNSTEPTQLLIQKGATNIRNAERIRHLTKAKAYSFNMDVYIDFRNDVLKKIFRDSYKENVQSAREIWTIKREFYVFNEATKQYEIDNDLTDISQFYLTGNAPAENVSKGDKYVFSLVFEPIFIT